MEKNNHIRLSPTSIACYFECPRKFFYRFIRGIEEKPRPSMIRGKIVHRVLEHFFTFVDLTDIEEGKSWQEIWEKFRKVLFSLLETEWNQIGKLYDDCFSSEKQKTQFLNETKEFLDFYAIKLAFSLMNKMKELNKNSQWFEEEIKRFFYPKNMEMKLVLVIVQTRKPASFLKNIQENTRKLACSGKLGKPGKSPVQKQSRKS